MNTRTCRSQWAEDRALTIQLHNSFLRLQRCRLMWRLSAQGEPQRREPNAYECAPRPFTHGTYIEALTSTLWMLHRHTLTYCDINAIWIEQGVTFKTTFVTKCFRRWIQFGNIRVKCFRKSLHTQLLPSAKACIHTHKNRINMPDVGTHARWCKTRPLGTQRGRVHMFTLQRRACIVYAGRHPDELQSKLVTTKSWDTSLLH